MSIDALYSEIEQTQAIWKELYDLLLKAQYDTNVPRATINNVSVTAFHRRVEWVFELLYGMRPSSEDDISWLALSGRSAEISSQLVNFKTHAQLSLNFLRQYWRDNLTIRDANNNFSWQLFDDATNIANQDASSNFAQMQNSVNQLTTYAAQLLPLCKTEGLADLSVRAQAMGDVIREIEGLRNEAKKLVKSAEQGAAGATEKDKAVHVVLAQVEAIYAKLQAIQQQASADSASVTALVAQIKTTEANAQTLEQHIAAYRVKFDAFQSELDDRQEQFSEFEANTKKVQVASTKREAEIDRLTKIADAMISGATTAGLSTSLEDTRARYEKRMNGAKKGFYWAVAILILFALPLVAQLVPGLFGSWFPLPNPNQDGTPYTVLGKIFLLLPATWLTAFFTKSYAEYFHLEREYAHKAALAKSVDGFKRQAPKYEEEITAEVFMEIRTNPANRDGPEPAAHPLYDVLSKVVSKVIGKNDKKE
ncbi:MAG TPA: hypothetical protein VMV97_02115 [Sulfuriferula sp.]|nr:hypothetical protein [Sulfuriferula sp.]